MALIWKVALQEVKELEVALQLPGWCLSAWCACSALIGIRGGSSCSFELLVCLDWPPLEGAACLLQLSGWVDAGMSYRSRRERPEERAAPASYGGARSRWPQLQLLGTRARCRLEVATAVDPGGWRRSLQEMTKTTGVRKSFKNVL